MSVRQAIIAFIALRLNGQPAAERVDRLDGTAQKKAHSASAGWAFI
jgi:hypothetical protein